MTYFFLAMKITVLILLSKVAFKQFSEQKSNRLIIVLACSLLVSTLYVVFGSKSLGFGLPFEVSFVSALFITLLASFYLYNQALKVKNIKNI